MNDRDLLARRFEAHRQHLRSVALRMLGSSHEADDAVQEAWMRLSRSDTDAVDNLGGWLTTVVARVCLDMLRSRSTKREVPAEEAPDPVATTSPEDEALLADSVGLALLVVLDTLAPAERLAFVLHDMFAVPFEDIAPIVGRTPVATRQLASRARRRVQSEPSVPNASAAARRQVVAAFLAASRGGDFSGLLRLLDPQVVLRADAVAVHMAAQRAQAGAPALRDEVRGADAVARIFASGARVARLVLVDGLPGAAFFVGGRPRVVFGFTVRDGRVVGIDLLADPETLGVLHLEPVKASTTSVPSCDNQRGRAVTPAAAPGHAARSIGMNVDTPVADSGADLQRILAEAAPARRAAVRRRAGSTLAVIGHYGSVPDYRSFPRFYDAVMDDPLPKSTRVLDAKATYLPKASSLLELGCGTGGILAGLSGLPSLTGLDRSPEMLAIARTKVPQAHLIEADMATFDIGQRFDVVICVFDTLNHLPSFSLWNDLFERTYDHLVDGGLFVFDVNPVGQLRQLGEAPPWVHEFDGNTVIMDVEPDGDDLWLWETKIFEHVGDGRFILHRERIHELGVALGRIESALAPRFRVLEVADPTGGYPNDDSIRAYFVTRRR